MVLPTTLPGSGRSHRTVLLAVVAGLVVLAPQGVAHAAAPPLVVTHVGVVDRQDIPAQDGSENDTVVEPDVAVDPRDPAVAVAAAHDSRFADGGAVTISTAWTADGGATWQHAPVRGITKATGGIWDRASDPVVTFGPDGSAYLSVLLISLHCPSAVGVLRSTDGGRTWGALHYAHRSWSCDYSDDKNWLVVDDSARSPHHGRLYQFWTPFLSTGRRFIGSPQVVRWSDDHGVTWSATHLVSARNHGTQNSQPMITADGRIVDTFYDYGKGNRAPDVVTGGVGPAAAGPAIDPEGDIYATTSADGGATWSPAELVTTNGAGYAPGVRCCLFGADIDAVTGTMYVAWEGGGPGRTDPVLISSSHNGVQWSSPVRVSSGDVNDVWHVNVDVSARAGRVFVSYGTATDVTRAGGTVRQQLSSSTDAGRSFAAPLTIGPVSNLRYAARAGGFFPGDYIGTAVTAGRLYLVWAVSSHPPATSTSPYHQVIFGATLTY